MKQYPLTFDDEQSFAQFLGVLRLTLRRLSQGTTPPDNMPLDARENRALDVISRQLQVHIDRRPPEAKAEAEAIIEQAKAIMGMRGYLNFFLVQTQIMGVPYTWFVLNALGCLIVFIATTSFNSIFFVAPVVHVIGYVVWQPRLKQQREDSIKKLLGEIF